MKPYNKYGNTKVIIDNIPFDSKREAARYSELKLLQRAGEIRELGCQPTYLLQAGFSYNGKKERPISYRGDFEYVTKNGDKIIEDVKGARTEIFKLKRKLFLFKYPHLIFLEI